MNLLSSFVDLPSYMLIAAGFYVAYRILNFPDLTVDASWVAGTVGAACGALYFKSSGLGIVFAVLLSGLAGVATALIYLANPRPAYKLLAGVLVVLIYFSLDFHLLGEKLNVHFSQQPTSIKALLDFQDEHGLHSSQPFTILLGLALVSLQFAGCYWLFHTRFGLKLRTIGTRPHIIATRSRELAPTLIVGLVLSNVIVGVGGWLFAVCNGWSDITIFGIIISALTSVIIGEMILACVPKLKDSRISLKVVLATPLIGACVYHLLRQLINWAMIGLSRDSASQAVSVNHQDQTALLAGLLIAIVMAAKLINSSFRISMVPDQSTIEPDEDAI
ncbi:hypothetical protein DB347_25115 [Opitutaceae bacterium EW11]|nr:hypothetical protein DB347_25115 [Opitutaceae bacterium EW11]